MISSHHSENISLSELSIKCSDISNLDVAILPDHQMESVGINGHIVC